MIGPVEVEVSVYTPLTVCPLDLNPVMSACRFVRRPPALGFWKLAGLEKSVVSRCKRLGSLVVSLHVEIDQQPHVGAVQGGVAGADGRLSRSLCFFGKHIMMSFKLLGSW